MFLQLNGGNTLEPNLRAKTIEWELTRRTRCAMCGHDASKEVVLARGVRVGEEIFVLEVDDAWLQLLGRQGECITTTDSDADRDFLFSLPIGTPLELIVRVKCES